MAEDRPDQRRMDRRGVPRGGRRDTDLWAYAPLVFLVDSDVVRREHLQFALLTCRFAVAPLPSADRALAALPALCPDAMLVSLDELDHVSVQSPRGRDGRPIPIVPLRADTHRLLESLRTAFRQRTEP
jgi:hypothetical protein